MKDFTAARASLKRYKQSQERQAKRGGGGAGGGGVRSKQDKRNEQVAIKKDEQDNIPELDSTQPPSSSTSSKPAAATSHPVVLPKMHDEQKWRTLLYGPTPSPSAPVSQVASTTTAVLTEVAALLTPSPMTPTTATATSTTITATTTASETTRPAPRPTGAILQGWMPPSPRFLIRLDQGHLIQLLRYHLRWLAEDDLQEHEVR